MSTHLTIEEVMHPLPHTIGINQTIARAQEMLREHQIRHLPVCDRGRLCGVLSDRDIEFALRVDRRPPEELRVNDCFTPDPLAVEGNASLESVARTMATQRIGCVVITENERVKGIFTTVDACRVLGEVLSAKKD